MENPVNAQVVPKQQPHPSPEHAGQSRSDGEYHGAPAATAATGNIPNPAATSTILTRFMKMPRVVTPMNPSTAMTISGITHDMG